MIVTLVVVSIMFAANSGDPEFAEKDLDEKTMEEPDIDGFGITRSKAKAEPEGVDNIDIRVKKELKSGPSTIMPWENDDDYKRKMESGSYKVLMAGYRTVLVDPLPGEEYNVHLAAKMLSGRVIEPGQVFSQNHEIGPYDESKGFREGPTYVGSQLITTIGGGVCKISSTLYNVAVLSNLKIVQRYNHSMPVPYVPYGQDATVAYGGRDFQFQNDTDFPILIWAKGIDNILYIAFYGREKPPKVEWQHETRDIQKAPTIYKNTPDLPRGMERKVVEGMDGAMVKSRVIITRPHGAIETKDMGMSHYKPMPHLIERGT